ncbi:MAG: ATP-dependent helicase [Saprospiraceae bacterium]|nr:ATP-dependent helicase [Saprospiraceae bacterium]
MHDLPHYHAVFERELARLNPAQREAVTHIEGPVLVLAGPGTGKTHVLAARIGRILQETDAQAANILCLTFTDAGVHAMRERLLQWIGPEGHRVHIFTFHSFCNSVIQDNLEYFGRSDLEPLSDLERVDIIRQLLDDLDANHALRRRQSDPYFYEAHLHDLFRRMKAENWTAELIDRQIDAYLDSLPFRKEFIYQTNTRQAKKGDPKQAKIDEIREKMERLRAAAHLFPPYTQALLQARRYDYEDMILWVLKAFKENEALLRTYQEQYLYLLVDEYQDTNGAQNEVLQQLISYWDSPNIFIVGDDDQSIFEFQGARLKNLTDFFEQYRHEIKLVTLTDNYRSSQHILDTSEALIAHNEKRVVNNLQAGDVSKSLLARHDMFADSDILPHMVCYANRLQEDADIVAQIEQLHLNGFPLEEVAVIYAKHKQARRLIALLEKKGIPYNTRRRVNILDLPLIATLRQMMEYAQAELSRPYSGEYLLFRILHVDFVGCLPADIAKLSAWLSGLTDKTAPHWREVIGDEKLLGQLPLQQTAALLRLSAWLEQLLADLVNMPLASWLERLINRSGLLDHVLHHPDKVWLLQVLSTFFEFVRTESDKHPRLSLRRLLEVLHRMDDNRLAIELNKNVTAAGGVNLVTAHSAKGLEFQYVFVIDCVKDQWEPQRRGNSYRFTLPDTLTFSGEEDALEARRRLFYVAMTRAKAHLHLSYSRSDANESPLARAVFIDELAAATSREALEKVVPPAVVLEAQWLQLLEAETPRLPEQEKAEIDALLEGFTLSVSALNRFLRCPLSFYYENVLRTPVLQSEAASYGIAVHQALQRVFDRMTASYDKHFPQEEEFVGFFEHAMEQQRGYFGARDWERRLQWGRRHLPAFYRQYVLLAYKRVRVELNIRRVEVEGVPLSGVIDKVELHDGLRTVVVDYKTGRPDASRWRPPTDKSPHGGTYWRQLVFYKLLYEAYDPGSRRVEAGQIVCLDPDSKGHFPVYTVAIDADAAGLMRQMIVETYDRIHRHDFYEGCGRPDCTWCNFTRRNTPVDSFADAEIEGLDD